MVRDFMYCMYALMVSRWSKLEMACFLRSRMGFHDQQ